MTRRSNLAQALHREIEPGETVLWSGQPGAGHLWRQNLGIMVFAIPWTAFALFWMAAASQGSIWFAMFGLPFVAIGLFMLTTPFWAARRARFTAYAITDRRILIIEGATTRTTRTYTPAMVNDLERRERPNGSGDLLFGPAFVGESSSSAQVLRRPGFYDLPDVRAVERTLLGMLARHGRASIEEAG